MLDVLGGLDVSGMMVVVFVVVDSVDDGVFLYRFNILFCLLEVVMECRLMFCCKKF